MSKDLYSKDLQKLIQRKKLHLNRIRGRSGEARFTRLPPGPLLQYSGPILSKHPNSASRRTSTNLPRMLGALETRPKMLIPVGPGVAASSVSAPLPEIRLFILGLFAATS